MVYLVKRLFAAFPSYPFSHHESVLGQDHNPVVYRNSSETQLAVHAQQASSLAWATQEPGSHLQSVCCFHQPEAALAEIQLSLADFAETRLPLAEPAERQLPFAEPAEAQLPTAEPVGGPLTVAETADTGLRLAAQHCSSLVVQLSTLQSEVNC